MVRAKNNWTLRRAVGVAGALSCLLAASAASAADDKAYHGAFCKASRIYNPVSMQWTDYSSVVETAVDHIGARTGTAIVVCPIARDRTGSTTQADLVAVELHSASGNTFSCTLYSQGEDSSGYSIDSDSDSTSGVGDHQLTMGGADLTTTSGGEGSYALECTIPSGDDLFHYFVEEEAGTD